MLNNTALKVIMAAIDEQHWEQIKGQLPALQATVESWVGILNQGCAVDQVIVIAHQCRSIIKEWLSYNNQALRDLAIADGLDVAVDLGGIKSNIDTVVTGVKNRISIDGSGYILDRKIDDEGLTVLDTLTPAQLAPLITVMNNLNTNLVTVIGKLA